MKTNTVVTLHGHGKSTDGKGARQVKVTGFILKKPSFTIFLSTGHRALIEGDTIDSALKHAGMTSQGMKAKIQFWTYGDDQHYSWDASTNTWKMRRDPKREQFYAVKGD